MQVLVCDTNNTVHKSDRYTKERIMQQESMSAEGYDAMVANMQKMFKRLDDLENVILTINGRERIFNPHHIVWIEIDTEE